MKLSNFYKVTNMKRLILMLLMVIGIGMAVNAQTYYYRTTAFAIKQMNDYGRWSDWSDWEDSDMLMTINFDDDVVKIFSPTPQKYVITKYVKNYTDSSGGKQVEFKFVDQDGDRGNMRLRIERSGNSQVYIEFGNIMWVYNVKRTY